MGPVRGNSVTDMGNMFERTKFNNEITEWDVRMFSVVISFVKDLLNLLNKFSRI